MLFLLLFVSKLQSNHPSIKNTGCDLFNIEGKKIDTIAVVGKLLEIEQLPQGSPALNYLEKKKQIPLRHHYYSVKIRFNGCDSDRWVICGDNTKKGKLITGSSLPSDVRLTCVIFRNKNIPAIKSEPFVIVQNITNDTKR